MKNEKQKQPKMLKQRNLWNECHREDFFSDGISIGNTCEREKWSPFDIYTQKNFVFEHFI